MAIKTGKRRLLWAVTAWVLLAVALTGCFSEPPPASAASEAGSAEELPDGPSAPVEETESSSAEEDAGGDASSDQERMVSFSERIRELGLDIPAAYIEVVERETAFPAEAYAYLEHYTDEDKDARRSVIGVEILEHKDFYLIHLCLGGEPYDQKNEYHVFDKGQYTGMFGFDVPLHGKERFEQFKDRVWMIVDVYGGHGMGAMGFHRTRQVWFEISHPDLDVALAFTTVLGAGTDYPGILSDYNATVIDTQIEKGEEEKETFVVNIHWREILRGGNFGPTDDNIPLFDEEGDIQYSYEYDHNYFYQPKDGIPIGGLVFTSDKDESAITNGIYDEQSTLYGRDKYNLLLTYRTKMIEMSKNGTEEQKMWLGHFLESFDELDEIAELYNWRQSSGS